MNILITGCAGLIGSRLAAWICDHHPGVKIIGIDDLSGGYLDNVPSRVHFLQTNLEDKLDWIFAEHAPDIVYHMAAYAAEGLSPFIRTYNYKNNLIATARVLNGCIQYGVTRLVFTSSMAVYGEGVRRPFDDADTPIPVDPYGVAKYAAEMDIQIAGAHHGLDWCIIRPHNVYGAHQNIWDKYRNVLGIWMYQHLNNRPMTIFGDGTQTRAFSCIDDCLAPLWQAGTSPSASRAIINLGGTRRYSILQANQILQQVMGGGTTVHLEARREVRDAYPTWQRSMDLLGYRDDTTLQEGLTRMWRWALAQPMRPQRVWDAYELDKGLYQFWKV